MLITFFPFAVVAIGHKSIKKILGAVYFYFSIDIKVYNAPTHMAGVVVKSLPVVNCHGNITNGRVVVDGMGYHVNPIAVGKVDAS